MLRGLKKQRGMTGLGWLTIMFLIGFFAFLGVKIIPTFLENYQVKSVVKSLKEEPMITKKSVREIRKLIKKRLTINSVYDLKKEDIKIKKSGGVTTVEIAYEVRKPMVSNIFIVIAFSDKVELVSN